MTQEICVSCRKQKTTLACVACENPLCKKCAQPVDESNFLFLEALPASLKEGIYCPVCFNSQVAPELDSYEEHLAKAREVYVFYKAEGKETRTFRRSEKPIQVTGCADKEEAILKLAFLAAREGFNGILDVEITNRKINIHGYQSSECDATARPFQVDEKKLR